jgi:hypothetical protein
MVVFPIRIEHALDMAVQGSHDANARKHRRAARCRQPFVSALTSGITDQSQRRRQNNRRGDQRAHHQGDNHRGYYYFFDHWRFCIPGRGTLTLQPCRESTE